MLANQRVYGMQKGDNNRCKMNAWPNAVKKTTCNTGKQCVAMQENQLATTKRAMQCLCRQFLHAVK